LISLQLEKAFERSLARAGGPMSGREGYDAALQMTGGRRVFNGRNQKFQGDFKKLLTKL